jgi:hypothetical protein
MPERQPIYMRSAVRWESCLPFMAELGEIADPG